MTELLNDIQALELELHHPGVKCHAARLEQLLHKDFHEVGRSGSAYDRSTIIRFLGQQEIPPSVVSEHFTLVHLAADVVLLTYRSAHLQSNSSLDRHTLRSSIWVRDQGRWQLRYHQGTPAAVPW